MHLQHEPQQAQIPGCIQHLWDECCRLLLVGKGDVDAVAELLLLEKFITQLPSATGEWAQCHSQVLLMDAAELAEDRLSVYKSVGDDKTPLKLSISFFSLFPFSLSHEGLASIADTQAQQGS